MVTQQGGTQSTRPRARTHSSSSSVFSLTQLSTIRLIFKTDCALQAFLCYVAEVQTSKHTKYNFIQSFLYLESIDPNIIKFGRNVNNFHHFSSYSNLLRDDLDKSREFLKELMECEQYLMVVSVICGLNDFMRSDWHALWQQIEMQCTDPGPQTFPSVCHGVAERFSMHDSELQFFLKTVDMLTVFDLLVSCLKHLPFPLAVMEMSPASHWFPISTVNAAFVALTGYSDDEIRGMTIESLCSDLDGELLALMRTGILQGDVSRAILPLRRHDGSIMTCAVGLIPILDANHSVINFLGLLDDVASPNFSLTRLKILSDLLDSISPHLNILTRNVRDCHSFFEVDKVRSGLLI